MPAKSTSPETAPGDGARRAALRLLRGVFEERLTLAEQLPGAAFSALPPAERARGQRLALVTLRNLARADAILKPLLRKAPPDDVMALLRLATVELLAEGAAAHGVVNAAVTLARESGRKSEPLAAMVNAVLRRVSETDLATFAALPAPPLAPWLRRRLIEAWGKSAVQTIERVQERQPPVDITLRDGDPDHWARQLGAEVLPTGSLRLPAGAQISDLPGYADGAWWVQDAAAALAARALHAGRGERIADLCAAPGGKTLQLAAAGAEVTAVDSSPARMERVRQNLERCRLSAQVVVADALTWQADAFDAVLVDPPCSATGTIRRHPELPLIRDGSMLADLVALQAAMLDRAVALTRPGGRMIFCTCSLLPQEGEAQLAAAMVRHPGLTAEPAALALPGVPHEWITESGGLRLRPDHWAERGGMDGFFIAALRKAG
jgi:16S rRNA (cytosine967-C5)-methyltransferase